MQDPKEIIRIAYLAPEIPATSATFVYNEILGLQEKGLNVVPFSIHCPSSPATEPVTKRLNRVVYLYKQKKIRHIINTFKILKINPSRFYSVLKMLFKDMKEINFFTVSAFKLVYQYFVAHTLALEFLRLEIQHLHIHFGHVPTQVGMYAASITGIPFTFTTHANDIFQRGLLLSQKAKRAKKVITISEYNRTYLHSKSIPWEKIAVVRCGVNIQNKYVEEKEPRTVPIIGSLGRLVEKKGFDVLIKACGILRKQGYTFRLQIAGFGPLLDNLIGLAEEYNISDIVKFVGELRHDKVAIWLQSLDIFALSSKKDRNDDTDGIPVVLMEAMAVGIPVVSTVIGGIPELIEHGENGLLALPNDEQAFSDELRKILTNQISKSSLIEAAQNKILKEFDINLNINRIYKIITERANEE